MNQIEMSIISLLDLMGYLIISSRLVGDIIFLYEKKKLITIITFMLLLSFVMGMIGFSSIGKYIYIWGFIASILFIYLIYRKNLKETVYIYIISTVILLIVQYLVLAILLVFNVDKVFDFKSGLLAQILILPILILLNKYIPLNLLLNFISKKNKVFTCLILNMLVVLMSILVYKYIFMEGLLRDILIIAILSIGLLFVNLVIIKNGLVNEYEEQMLSTYKKYLPIIDELVKELKSKQHEFDNHMQALNMITITSTDYESLVHLMKRYIEDLNLSDGLEKLVKLDNKILAGFLYEKTIKSKENNIDFQIEIYDYDFKSNLKDYQLIEVIGNLIDNSFETDIDNNKVKLILKREGNMSAIEVKNVHSYIDVNTLSKFFTLGYSTKFNNEHGYGLSNIKKIINNTNGSISVQNETMDGVNYIVFRILLVRI